MKDAFLRIGRAIAPAESRRGSAIGTMFSAFWMIMAGLELRELDLERDDGATSPLDRYQRWTASNQPNRDELEKRLQQCSANPTFRLLMDARGKPSEAVERTLASLRNQIYSNWNTSVACRSPGSYTSGEPRCKFSFYNEEATPGDVLNDLWNRCPADFVGIFGAGDILRDDALAQFTLFLSENSAADLGYSDEDFCDGNGNVVSFFFKPDWSPDLLLSRNYLGRLTFFSERIADKVFQPTAGDIDHVTAIRGSGCARKIIHIPMPLCRRMVDSTENANELLGAETRKEIKTALSIRGIDANVSDGAYASFHVSYALTRSPLVTVIIITRDRLEYLRKCVDSLTQKTAYENFEIVVVDHRSRDVKTLEYLRRLPHKVIRFDGGFNFARINNLAAREGRGDLLVFLNNDTEVLDARWLTEMVSVAMARSDVGVVGAKLLYPDGTIQHAGAIVGAGGSAGHAFAHLPNESPGYFNLPHTQRNVGAVTAACMLTKRELFDSLGGFDERFSVGGNDVDYCLRALEKGFLTVYCPHAVLLHHEGATRQGFPPHNYYFFLKKWKRVIASGDPFYNPHLSLIQKQLYWPKVT